MADFLGILSLSQELGTFVKAPTEDVTLPPPSTCQLSLNLGDSRLQSLTSITEDLHNIGLPWALTNRLNTVFLRQATIFERVISRDIQQRSSSWHKECDPLLPGFAQHISSKIEASFERRYQSEISKFRDVFFRLAQSWVDRCWSDSLSRVPVLNGPRRHSRVFQKETVATLQKLYQMNQYPNSAELKAIAKMVDMDYKQTMVWFQNRRNRKTSTNSTEIGLKTPLKAAEAFNRDAKVLKKKTANKTHALLLNSKSGKKSDRNGDREEENGGTAIRGVVEAAPGPVFDFELPNPRLSFGLDHPSPFLEQSYPSPSRSTNIGASTPSSMSIPLSFPSQPPSLPHGSVSFNRSHVFNHTHISYEPHSSPESIFPNSDSSAETEMSSLWAMATSDRSTTYFNDVPQVETFLSFVPPIPSDQMAFESIPVPITSYNTISQRSDSPSYSLFPTDFVIPEPTASFDDRANRQAILNSAPCEQLSIPGLDIGSFGSGDLLPLSLDDLMPEVEEIFSNWEDMRGFEETGEERKTEEIDKAGLWGSEMFVVPAPAKSWVED